MKTEIKIIKVKNPDGEKIKCSVCGHEIKNIYIVAGMPEIPENMFGSECAKHMGYSGKDIKRAEGRMKMYEYMIARNIVTIEDKMDVLMGYIS